VPINLMDARGHEPTARPERLAFKDADAATGQVLAVEESEGVVTAVVSVTGTQDEVNDIIVPGAYRDTLVKRRPKVCWAHSWERPVGRVLHIEELLPNDDRLPAQTKDGNPWPRDAGALVATMQFNMASEAGREAFEAVKFYSETGECEYSIGYQVPSGKSVRDKAGVRHIKALELYELSVVLFGAHTMTGTLSIKAALAAAVERKRLHDVEGIDYAVLAAAAERKDVGATPEEVTPDLRDGVMVALYPDPAAADRIAEAIQGPDDVIERDDLHVTLAYLGTTADVSLTEQEIVDAVTNAVTGERILTGNVGGIGMFPADDEGNVPTWAPVDVPGLSLLRETIVDSLGDDMVRNDHGFTPHMTLGYNIGLIDPLPEIPVTFATVKIAYGQQIRDVDLGSALPDEEKALTADQRRRAPTMPGDGDRFPIRNISDLDKAIKAYGRAKDKAKAKRWIIRRARELGAVAHLPDSWNVTKGLDVDLDLDLDYIDLDVAAEMKALLDADPEVKAALAAETKARTPGGREGNDSPVGTPGGRQNWVDKVGGLPRYIRMVAHALIRKGMSKSRAIATAVNTMKRWAAGGNNVTAKVQAAAAAALAEWESMRARSKGTKVAAYTPALDAARPAVAPQRLTAARTGAKGYPRLPGSEEERRDAIRAAVSEALTEDHPGDDDEPDAHARCDVSIDATFPDRVIATRMYYGPVDKHDTYEIPYQWADDVVSLGEPRRVTLEVVAVSQETGEDDDETPLGDAMPLAEDIGRVTFALKRAASVETKAGRVLSGSNEQQLRVAVGNLLAVLAAAGVRVEGTMDTPDDELPGRVTPNSQRRSRTTSGRAKGDARIEVDPSVDLTTTSPSATTKSIEGVVLDAADLQATLDALLDE